MEIIDIFYIYFQLIDGLAVAAKPGGGQRGHLPPHFSEWGATNLNPPTFLTWDIFNWH